jgi:hypothetical protein
MREIERVKAVADERYADKGASHGIEQWRMPELHELKSAGGGENSGRDIRNIPAAGKKEERCQAPEHLVHYRGAVIVAPYVKGAGVIFKAEPERNNKYNAD